MFCPFCGGANPEGSTSCSHCGQPLRPGGQQASHAHEVQPSAPGDEQVPIFAAPPSSADQPPPSDDPITPYTCLVCGYILGPTDTVCARCKTPRGLQVNPASPMPGSYAQTGGWYAGNTSGQPQGEVPTEVRGGWNWGAFWFSWIWGVNHRSYITFLTLPCVVFLLSPPAYVLVSLGLRIWFGVLGNQWAWQGRQFESVEHFRAVQRVWAYWTLGMAIVAGLTLICILALAAIGFAAMAANPGAFRE